SPCSVRGRHSPVHRPAGLVAIVGPSTSRQYTIERTSAIFGKHRPNVIRRRLPGLKEERESMANKRDSIIDRFLLHHRIRPAAPAYYEKTGSAWVPTSWEEYTAQVRTAARALMALDVQPGDVVCMLGFNRPEWVV